MKHLLTIFIISFAFFVTLVTAQESLQYHQRTLPDGSTEMIYDQADGATLRQVRRPDGVIETYTHDANGNEVVTTRRIDGSLERRAVQRRR